MATAASAGRSLAERHLAAPAEPESEGSLLNYAESSRHDDWSLRSALVRLAQPHPATASAVLELVRRTDAALHPLARALEHHTVWCDRNLGAIDTAEADRRYADARVTDVARLLSAEPEDHDALIAGYEAVSPLGEQERASLALLQVALELDGLAEVLTAWASTGPEHLPVDDVDARARRILEMLEDQGVPHETAPPPRSRRRG